MFGKKPQKTVFDMKLYRPVIMSSICTGEQTAGFKEISTGKFIGVEAIRSQEDLKRFCVEYGIELQDIKKEW